MGTIFVCCKRARMSGLFLFDPGSRDFDCHWPIGKAMLPCQEDRRKFTAAQLADQFEAVECFANVRHSTSRRIGFCLRLAIRSGFLKNGP